MVSQQITSSNGTSVYNNDNDNDNDKALAIVKLKRREPWYNETLL